VGEREQRIAKNETTFRAANEELRSSWDELQVSRAEHALFVCECGNPRCTRVMRLTLAEYENVRADANTFAVLPGHDDARTEMIVSADLLESNDRFSVVKKRPENRADTESTDPRA
jgi:hypothetical protein